VNRVEVERVVERSPETVYEAVADFRRYPRYSKYLERVREDRRVDGLPHYTLEFAWWRLTYDVSTRVVAANAPNYLDWEITTSLDASGRWSVESLDDGSKARLVLRADYDPDSVGDRAVSLPFGVSLDWVLDKAVTLVENEADRVIDRIVKDVEG